MAKYRSSAMHPRKRSRVGPVVSKARKKHFKSSVSSADMAVFFTGCVSFFVGDEGGRLRVSWGVSCVFCVAGKRFCVALAMLAKLG